MEQVLAAMSRGGNDVDECNQFAPNRHVMSRLARPSIEAQVARGLLVCPKTRQPLVLKQSSLETLDGEHSYPLVAGVPLLFADEKRVRNYLGLQQGRMVTEYTSPRSSSIKAAWRSLMSEVGDMRSSASEEAFQSIFSGLSAESLCISVGGGPTRVHPALVNVNLGLFPNVDVAADAYQLPYADGAADAIHCEAVLEHLEFPDGAVKEMHRVLRPGGRLFAATPFLQGFHGYPDHYQNFTLTGHRRLFERAGFSVSSAGTCVGPTFALRDLATNYIRRAIPGSFGKVASALYSLCTVPLLYLDRTANRRDSAADLASTTYVSAVK